MDELSQALESFQRTFKKSSLSVATSPMPPLGSISVDGSPTIALSSPASQGELTAFRKLPILENQSGKSPQPEYSKKSRGESFSPEDQASFTIALMQVCQLQQEFGKRGEDFETMVKGFLWVLGDYRMSDILEALKDHIRAKSTIPTPSDLVNIIDPPEQPLSAAVYVAYQKRAKEGHFLLSDERVYCRAYESQEMGKVRGGISEYREAQREIESHSSRLAIGIGQTYDLA